MTHPPTPPSIRLQSRSTLSWSRASSIKPARTSCQVSVPPPSRSTRSRSMPKFPAQTPALAGCCCRSPAWPRIHSARSTCAANTPISNTGSTTSSCRKASAASARNSTAGSCRPCPFSRARCRRNTATAPPASSTSTRAAARPPRPATSRCTAAASTRCASPPRRQVRWRTSTATSRSAIAPMTSELRIPRPARILSTTVHTSSSCSAISPTSSILPVASVSCSAAPRPTSKFPTIPASSRTSPSPASAMSRRQISTTTSVKKMTTQFSPTRGPRRWSAPSFPRSRVTAPSISPLVRTAI